ncbi:MAG: DUF6153 family protein [Actinomycetota bacterium]|nr:DUF6153 family protein [Actinomycetota bacterium]
MGVTVRRESLRWLLLLIVAFGVVGMHHLTIGSGQTPEVSIGQTAHGGSGHDRTEPSESPQHSTHDLLHLCMAIVTSLASIMVLALLPRTVVRRVRLPRTTRLACPSPGPPPPWGRLLLSTVCVLRL